MVVYLSNLYKVIIWYFDLILVIDVVINKIFGIDSFN